MMKRQLELLVIMRLKFSDKIDLIVYLEFVKTRFLISEL